MDRFDVVSKIPGLGAAVLSDESGNLLESVGNIDGETAGAVNAFSREALAKAGDMLGLGGLDRIVIASPSKAYIVTVRPGYVLSAHADAGKPFLAVEKRLTEILSR